MVVVCEGRERRLHKHVNWCYKYVIGKQIENCYPNIFFLNQNRNLDMCLQITLDYLTMTNSKISVSYCLSLIVRISKYKTCLMCFVMYKFSNDTKLKGLYVQLSCRHNVGYD